MLDTGALEVGQFCSQQPPIATDVVPVRAQLREVVFDHHHRLPDGRRIILRVWGIAPREGIWAVFVSCQ